jgi:hypothetical protein
VRLRVLIPAVENAVAGNAFRPGDILTARNGLTVEINNTDAEGRLVLADALALAAEETPDLMISMATLTGAARVAVGPDLAPFYTDDDGLAAALVGGAAQRGGRSGLAPALPCALRGDDRTGHRRSRQRAQGRLCRLDHRRAVPAPLRGRGPRLRAFRHLRLVRQRRARPAQGRARQGARAILESLSAPDFKAQAEVALFFGSAVHVTGERQGFHRIQTGPFRPAPAPDAHRRALRRPGGRGRPVPRHALSVGRDQPLGPRLLRPRATGALACGIGCPRDSDQQAEALGEDIEGDALQRGDLVFWEGHVGMMADAKMLLHANAHHMSVAYEPLKDAAARIEAAGEGAVTRLAGSSRRPRNCSRRSGPPG